jgi:hypothetical protein
MSSYAEGLEKQNEELQEQLAATQHDAAIGKEVLQLIEYMEFPVNTLQNNGCYLVQWGTRTEIPVSKHLWEHFKKLQEARRLKEQKSFASLLELFDQIEAKKIAAVIAQSGATATTIQQYTEQKQAYQKLDDDN